MKRKIFRFFFIAVVIATSFSFNSPEVNAGSPLCGRNPDPRYTDNDNPIARIGIVRLGTSDERSGTIPIGGSITLNATPRDGTSDRGTPTNGKGEPVWNIPGSTLQRETRKTDCFTPTITGKANGVLIITVKQDGVTSEPFTLTIGSGGFPIGGTDDSEKYEYCAFLNTKGGYTCIFSTRDDAKCDSTAGAAICTVLAATVPSNKCVRKELEQCSPTGGPPLGLASPSFPLPPPQESPTDLGALITSIFNWSLAIVGIAVFVMILYGGATWLVAAGSPALVSKAKEIIRNALLGAFLLFSAYLILNTINPDFVRQSTTLEPLRLPGDAP